VKWAVALVVVAVLSVVVALTLAVSASRDTVPERLRDCVVEGQAGIMRSDADLGAQARSDAGAGALREAGRTRLGEDTAVLLEGTGYRVLVLGAKGSPSLEGDLARRVLEQTPTYALVAKETDPISGVLRGCIQLVAGRESAG
jgi:hypothetical protein